MFRSRLKTSSLFQTYWTNASSKTESLSPLQYHWNQKSKYIHPTSSSSKLCNPLTFWNVKQILDWICNSPRPPPSCPLLSRNPIKPPCFHLIFPPSCQVPSAAARSQGGVCASTAAPGQQQSHALHKLRSPDGFNSIHLHTATGRD